MALAMAEVMPASIVGRQSAKLNKWLSETFSNPGQTTST